MGERQEEIQRLLEQLYEPLPKEPYDYRDRSVQPKCLTCGRFARWNNELKNWELTCMSYDYYDGYEHD